MKNFDETPSESPKLRTEVGFSDHNRQILSIFGSLSGQVLKFWSKIGLFSEDLRSNKENSANSLFVKYLNFDAKLPYLCSFIWTHHCIQKPVSTAEEIILTFILIWSKF